MGVGGGGIIIGVHVHVYCCLFVVCGGGMGQWEQPWNDFAKRWFLRFVLGCFCLSQENRFVCLNCVYLSIDIVQR